MWYRSLDVLIDDFFAGNHAATIEHIRWQVHRILDWLPSWLTFINTLRWDDWINLDLDLQRLFILLDYEHPANWNQASAGLGRSGLPVTTGSCATPSTCSGLPSLLCSAATIGGRWLRPIAAAGTRGRGGAVGKKATTGKGKGDRHTDTWIAALVTACQC